MNRTKIQTSASMRQISQGRTGVFQTGCVLLFCVAATSLPSTCKAVTYFKDATATNNNISSGTNYNINVRFTKNAPDNASYIIVTTTYTGGVGAGASAGQSGRVGVALKTPNLPLDPVTVGMTAPTVVTSQSVRVTVTLYNKYGTYIDQYISDNPGNSQPYVLNIIPPP